MKASAQGASDPYLAWARATDFSGHEALASRPANGWLPLLLKAPLQLAKAYPAWRVPRAYQERDGVSFWTAWVPAHSINEMPTAAVECAMSLPLRDPEPAAPLREPPEPAKDDAPVIGVIDNGCAFLNQTFSRPGEPGRSRLISLWRQRPAKAEAPEWRVPADFGYGLELLQQDIVPAPPDGESAAYARLGYPVDGQARLEPMLHGTHVMDIAAGLPQPLPAAASAKSAVLDAACHAELVFVELPQPLSDDSTGAGLDAFILDAVHYVLRRAGPDRRVLINLSLGAQAGPHDGGSLIEQALDALIEQQDGRLTICVAAGNGAEEQWHASGIVGGPGPGAKATVGWRTVPGDTTDSFMEVWVSARAAPALAGLCLDLTAPDGRSLTATVEDARPSMLPSTPEGPPPACVDLRQMPACAGRHRVCALVSLAPTAGARAGLGAGLWQVSVRAPAGRRCRIAFWLQRDTAGHGLGDALQSRLEGLSPTLRWNGQGALSHLAGAHKVITVGAARLSDGQRSRYSPSEGIRAWATADESPNVYGLLCSGGLSGSVFRISGTSAATPLVVRALANGSPSAAALTAATTGRSGMTRALTLSGAPLITPRDGLDSRAAMQRRT